MQYIEQPKELIIRDAYAIADAIAYRLDQENRQAKAIAKDGIMSNRASKLGEDIIRLQILINNRIKSWSDTYGTDTSWTQYIDGHRHAKKVTA